MRYLIILCSLLTRAITNVYFSGVYLSLKGAIYPNNSDIIITEIGETYPSNEALQCVTDWMFCCRYYRAGAWYYPSGGGMVLKSDSATAFYRSRGDDGTVNLNRVSSDVMMPTGRFCCVVPDATSTNVTLCANIGQSC